MNAKESPQTGQRGIWGRFFRMLWRARLPYVWIVIYIALTFGLTHVGVSVTEYTAEMFAGNVSFSGVILPFIIFSVASLLLGTVNGITNYVCTALIDRNLRRMVWRKVVHLPMSYYDSNEPSELLSRITTDTNTISALIMQVFVSCITSVYTLYVLTRRIISYEPALMLAILICVPVVVIIPAVMGKFNFGVSDRVNRANAQLTQEIAEKVNNLETVKSFSNEEREAKSGAERMKELFLARIRNSWIGQISSPMYLVAGLIQTLVIILVGRHYYMSGAITLTEWIAYFSFAASVCANITSFAGYWDSFKLAQGATNRVTHIMDSAEEQLHGGQSAENASGAIELRNVSFSYDGETTVLHHVSLTAPEGRITVVVGPSGSGKSTILNLLERFYAPAEGTVTVGGQDIAAFDLTSYRKLFTCITQNSVPVSGTIRDNLLYGIDRPVSDEELENACRLADAWEFISEYEKGLDEPVAESGRNFSGGQRQKMALAKVFLTDTPYIILDEATSAMDVRSTNRFLEALRREKAGKTVVMVAHNRQTVRYADDVVVLTDGAIEASGTPEEVVRTSAFFHTLTEGEDDNG